ncbi:MAG TPA: glutamate--cysteine ligase [Streptosporangiaceae bacterium]|nr:glutamate--cysteine ligase [Streptosporangiaceae bacterium]
MRTFGVEEELLLVNAESGYPVALANQVIRPDTDTAAAGDMPTHEFQQEQVETGTAVCSSLDELAAQLTQRRAVAARAAHRRGAEVVALGTSPLPVKPSVTHDERYMKMAGLYALTAQEQLTCGCHVHVSVNSEDEGVAVIDRIRPWLPPLLAMTANSPFWQGRDTRYASYRRQVWGRWPSAGPTELFGSPQGYHDTVSAMLRTGALLDEGMIYFDARLSRHYPTVEIRVGDVCMRVGDAVLLASLARALVETAAREWRQGVPPRPVRTEVLRLAAWRASRSGLDGELVDPVTGRAAPAEAVVRMVLGHAGAALADAEADTGARAGQLGTTTDLAGALLARGNGATAQRRIYARTDDLAAVVRNAVAHTLSSE